MRGISFLPNIEVLFKVLSLAFSAGSTIIISIINICGFNLRWAQRTKTLLGLLEIKRRYKIMKCCITEKQLEELINMLYDVMDSDGKLWFENTDFLIQKQEKLYGRIRGEQDRMEKEHTP